LALQTAERCSPGQERCILLLLAASDNWLDDARRSLYEACDRTNQDIVAAIFVD
jgi:hypothetical protein